MNASSTLLAEVGTRRGHRADGRKRCDERGKDPAFVDNIEWRLLDSTPRDVVHAYRDVVPHYLEHRSTLKSDGSVYGRCGKVCRKGERLKPCCHCRGFTYNHAKKEVSDSGRRARANG